MGRGLEERVLPNAMVERTGAFNGCTLFSCPTVLSWYIRTDAAEEDVVPLGKFLEEGIALVFGCPGQAEKRGVAVVVGGGWRTVDAGGDG